MQSSDISNSPATKEVRCEFQKHETEYSVALKIPFHFFLGIGILKRNFPVGGSAVGIERKVNPSTLFGVIILRPRKRPVLKKMI